jgi:hypothetical protein
MRPSNRVLARFGKIDASAILLVSPSIIGGDPPKEFGGRWFGHLFHIVTLYQLGFPTYGAREV